MTVYGVYWCIQALEQDRYSLRMQLAQQTQFKDNALEDMESIRLHMTAEHQAVVDRLTANHNWKVDQLTKQVHCPHFCVDFGCFGFVVLIMFSLPISLILALTWHSKLDRLFISFEQLNVHISCYRLC